MLESVLTIVGLIAFVELSLPTSKAIKEHN